MTFVNCCLLSETIVILTLMSLCHTNNYYLSCKCTFARFVHLKTSKINRTKNDTQVAMSLHIVNVLFSAKPKMNPTLARKVSASKDKTKSLCRPQRSVSVHPITFTVRFLSWFWTNRREYREPAARRDTSETRRKISLLSLWHKTNILTLPFTTTPKVSMYEKTWRTKVQHQEAPQEFQ